MDILAPEMYILTPKMYGYHHLIMFSRQKKIHKSLISGGYEGGKHGKYYTLSTNKKLNAKSCSIPLSIEN